MSDAAPSAPEDHVPPLLELRDGLPPVVETPQSLGAIIERLTAGSGPVAVDAERASGYRYSARAYLVQLRRAGAGTALVDPRCFDDLSDLGDALADTEWVLHAASQDLPCLYDLGMRPRYLFDTELAGRLLSYPRVGLAAMVEDLLGYRMRKEHSAVDWSTRPLPDSWLLYAALDVEMLIELRDVIREQLGEAGKLAWAEEEFAALLTATPTPPRREPWRRTSGIHRVRGRRGLAVVRALWEARDAIAAGRDVTPNRVLADAAIVEAAIVRPKNRQALSALAGFAARGAQRHLSQFAEAVAHARGLPDTELPELAVRYDGPPPAKAWTDKNPTAAGHLAACRDVIRMIAERHRLPVENLLAPETLRRLCWSPPDPVSEDAVASALRDLGAREWQIGLTHAALTAALRR